MSSWRPYLCPCVMALLLLAVISAGLALSVLAEAGAVGCPDFQHTHMNVFRDYVSVSESTYEALYREWSDFCTHHGRKFNVTSSEEQIRAAWAQFCSYRPITECDLRKSLPEVPGEVTLASSHSPVVNGTAQPTIVDTQSLRTWLQFIQLLVLVSLVAYVCARRICRRYVQCTQAVHGFDVPDAVNNHHCRAQFRR